MNGETNLTARIAAFSDGIFAVAITLLVQHIHVPPLEYLPTRGLSAALFASWPVYLAYVTSLLAILVMWINHHRMFQHIRWADHGLMIYNGLLLMGITLASLPTSHTASYIRQPDARIAVGLLNGLTLLIAVAFSLLWNHVSGNRRLLSSESDLRRVQLITSQFRFGLLLYAIGLALSFANVIAGVGMALALASFFALPENRAMSRPFGLNHGGTAGMMVHL